jgi:hypothetical protein
MAPATWTDWAFAGVACISGAALLAGSDRRLVLAALGGVFLGCTALLLGRLPLPVCLAMVASGCASTGILLLSTSGPLWPWEAGEPGALPQGRPFRLVVAAFILIAAAGLARGAQIPGVATSRAVPVTALALMGLGALQFGLSERSLRVCVGLLTALAGFETLYLVLEPSLAIVALLGFVQVVVALVASYLLLVVGASPADRAGQ